MQGNEHEAMLNSTVAAQKCDGRSTTSVVSSTASHLSRSLHRLPSDVVHYLCVFIPVRDLICHVGLVSKAFYDLIESNETLWYELWVSYQRRIWSSLIHPLPSSLCIEGSSLQAEDMEKQFRGLHIAQIFGRSATGLSLFSGTVNVREWIPRSVRYRAAPTGPDEDAAGSLPRRVPQHSLTVEEALRLTQPSNIPNSVPLVLSEHQWKKLKRRNMAKEKREVSRFQRALFFLYDSSRHHEVGSQLLGCPKTNQSSSNKNHLSRTPLALLDGPSTIKVVTFTGNTRHGPTKHEHDEQIVLFSVALRSCWRCAYINNFWTPFVKQTDQNVPQQDGMTCFASMLMEVITQLHRQQRGLPGGGSSSNGSSVPSPPPSSSGNRMYDYHLLSVFKRNELINSITTFSVILEGGVGVFLPITISRWFLDWCMSTGARQCGEAVASTTTTTTTTSIGNGFDAAPLPLKVVSSCFWEWQLLHPKAGIHTNDSDSDSSETWETQSSHSISQDALTYSSIEFSEVESEAITATPTPRQPTRVASADHIDASDSDGAASLESPCFVLLFPLSSTLLYVSLLMHVSFYNVQMYTWDSNELKFAVCSRIVSPTGHVVECRYFNSVRMDHGPRLFINMVFSPAQLPEMTIEGKINSFPPSDPPSSRRETSRNDASRSPHRVDNSDENDDSDDNDDGSAVDASYVYKLFWGGFGRVEVDVKPTVSGENYALLRTALGLPPDFPRGLLWNLTMYASGYGKKHVTMHTHDFLDRYGVSFVDAAEEAFGRRECYGLGDVLGTQAPANAFTTAPPPPQHAENESPLISTDASTQLNNDDDSGFFEIDNVAGAMGGETSSYSTFSSYATTSDGSHVDGLEQSLYESESSLSF